MPSVEYDLNMNHAGAGSLFLSISLGYFISLIGSGFISSHLTHKQTIIVSATTLGLVLIFTAFSPGLWTMRLGVFMVGIAAPTFIGFMGDVNSYGTGIALAGGAVFMGSFITGYLRFQDRSDTG